MRHYFKKLSSIILLVTPFIVIIISTLFAYWNLPQTFFQQDEWVTFGRMISQEKAGGLGNILKLPIVLGKGHFTPLSYYQMYFEFKLFGLSFEPYAYISIVTHIVNLILLFYFVYILLKNKFLAFCSSLVFSVGSISSQAVSWIAASPNTQGATLFLLLSLIFILKYLQNNKERIYYLGLALFLIGLLFKEAIIFFFILVPLLWVLFGQKTEKKGFLLFLKPLIALGFVYFLFRVSLFFIPSPADIPGRTVNLFLFPDIERSIVAPFRILPQAIIPQQYLINLSDIATLYFYPQYTNNGFVNPYFSQTIVFGRVIPLLSIPILLIGFIAYKFLIWKKEQNLSKSLIFSLAFIMLSALPYAFIPGELADLPIYESRYLHLAGIGVSIFATLVIYAVIQLLLKQTKYISLILFIILLPILFTHLTLTRAEINKVVKISTVRKSILESIKMSYPKLPQKVVFYTESDTAYYGMPLEEKMLPVQLGFGWMLLVWYQKNTNFPPCLFDSDVFLQSSPLAYGYKVCDGRGFGYFRDYDKLITAIKENNIPADNTIAFSWNGKKEELTDITKQIRGQIRKDYYEKSFGK